MARWYGFGHRDMMEMPWLTFLAYADAMVQQIETERAAAYMGGRPELLAEYQQHIDEWRRRQPPPG